MMFRQYNNNNIISKYIEVVKDLGKVHMIFDNTEPVHNHCKWPPMLQGLCNLSQIYLHKVQWVVRRSGGCLIKNILLFNYLEILIIIVAIIYWVARCKCLIYVFLCVVHCHLERYFFFSLDSERLAYYLPFFNFSL